MTEVGSRTPTVRDSDHKPTSAHAMANTTVRGALAIHGQNPQVCHEYIFTGYTWFTLITQYLVETVVRNRIYDSMYWKEHCFALTGETFSFNRPYLCTQYLSLSRNPDRQIHRIAEYRGRIWKSKADRVHLPSTQVVADSAREGDSS